MKKVRLSMIKGVHKEIVRFEQELDLSPVKIPDPEIIDQSLISGICRYYPLTLVSVGREEYYCIGQITLYRWLAAHMRDALEVECVVIHTKISIRELRQAALCQWLVARFLANVTPFQAKAVYEYVSENKDVWPNGYKSNTDLSNKLGVVALKRLIKKEAAE